MVAEPAVAGEGLPVVMLIRMGSGIRSGKARHTS